MRSNSDIGTLIAAIIGILGAVLGSAVTGYITWQVSAEQIRSQSIQFRSEAALNVLNYWTKALEDIYAAKGEFDAAKFSGGEIEAAAKALAKAASAGRARLGGDGEIYCRKIQDSANSIATHSAAVNIGEHYVKINDAFFELNFLYQDLRKETLKRVLDDSSFSERCEICRRAMGDLESR